MRSALRLISMLLLTMLMAGCGGGASTPPVIPSTPIAPAPSTAATVNSRANPFLGEVLFTRDATLRANLLRDTVVDRLEPSSSQPAVGDTGTPGLDIIPIRLSASATFTMRVDSPKVDHVVIRDARGAEVWRVGAGSSATISLDTSDYTFELVAVNSHEATVFIGPLTAGALPGVTISAFPPSVVGVETGEAAFVGDLASGPLNEPVLVASWGEFVRRFGGIDPARPTAAQVYQFFNLGGQHAYVVRATPGPGGGVPTLDAFDTALSALAERPYFDLLLVPDAARANDPPDAQLAAHAVSRAEGFGALAILEVPAAITTPAGAAAWLTSQPQLQSTWAAVYYGTLTANINGTSVHVGPAGTIAGFCAYTDQNAGVWSAPANTLPPCDITDAPVLSDTELATLHDMNISPVIMLSHMPNVWGARTSASNQTPHPHFLYVQQRRLYLYITKSLDLALQWTVFAPNDGNTWATVVNEMSVFLNGIWVQGALSGASAADAFSVSCALGSTMTAQDILNGIMRVNVVYVDLFHQSVEFTITQMMQGP